MRTRAQIGLAGIILGVILALVTWRGVGIPVLPLWLLPTTIAGLAIAWWPRRDHAPGGRILDLLTLFAVAVPLSLLSIFLAAQSRTQPAHIRYHGVRLTNTSAVAVGANADSLDVSLQGGSRGEPWKVMVTRERPAASSPAGSAWRLHVVQPPEELLAGVNGSWLAQKAAGALNIEFWQPLSGTSLRVGDSTTIDIPEVAAFGLPAGRYHVSLARDGDNLVLSLGSFSWHVWRGEDPLNFRNRGALRRGRYLGELYSDNPMTDAILPDLVRIRELSWRERVGEAKTVRAMAFAWLNQLRSDSPLRSRYILSVATPVRLGSDTTRVPFAPRPGTTVAMIARHGGDSWRFQWIASGTNVDVEFSRRPRVRSFPLTAANACTPGAACNVAGLRRLPPPVEQILLSEGGLDSTRFTLFGRFLAENRSVFFVGDSTRVPISSEGSWLPAGRVTPARGAPSAFVHVSAARNSVANPVQVFFISAGLTFLLLAMFFAIRAGVAEGTVRVGALAERPFALALLALLSLALARLILGLRVTVFAPFNPLGVSTAVGLWVSLATAVGALLTWKLWYAPWLDGVRGPGHGGLVTLMKTIPDRASKLGRRLASLSRDVRLSVWLGVLAVGCLLLTTRDALVYGIVLGIAVPALWAGVSTGVVWASSGDSKVIASVRVGAWGFLEAHLPAQSRLIARIVIGFASSGMVAVLFPVIFLATAVALLVAVGSLKAIGRLTNRDMWEPSQPARQLFLTIAGLGAPLSVLALSSASKSAAALGLALYVGMVALRLSACLAQVSDARPAARATSWVSAIGLPFGVLVLLLPLVAIDVGLFLVVVIPVMLASIIAVGGSRSGTLRRAFASLILVAATCLIGWKLVGQPADEILAGSPVQVDQQVRSMQSWLYLDRVPKLRRSLANVAARGLAAKNQRAAERALLLAGPSETRDFLAPAIEQSWGTKAYSASGWRGVGLGEAPVGNRGIATAVSYAEHSFAVFVLAEHGLLGGMTIILMYLLLSSAAIGMLALRTDLLIGARNFSMRGLLFLSAGLVIIPATYVALSNVGALPITGQNMPFLGLNARSDVLFTTGALTFFLIAAMRLNREAVGHAVLRSRADA